jgi:hypothetical protein
LSTVLDPPPAALPAAAELVARVRARWRRGVLLRALLVAPALLLGAALALLLLDAAAPLPAAWRAGLRWLPPLLALAALVRGVLRAVRLPDAGRFALLAEEREPILANRLVTALGAEPGEGSVARAFQTQARAGVAAADPRRMVPLAASRPAAALAAALVVGGGLALLAPTAAREAWARWSAPADVYEAAWREIRGAALPGVLPPAPIPGFDELRWTVRPPAYTGLPGREMRGGEVPSVLPGSRVRLRGRFPPRWERVRASPIGGGVLPVRRAGGEWSVEWTQGTAERGVALEALVGDSAVARRVAALLPATDAPPEVSLDEPAEDLVFASPAGRVPVRARATDDFGVAELRLTWIRSRGSGEIFSFAEGEIPWTRLGRSGGGVAGEHTLDLAALGLEPGDVLHLRAVARDRNDVTGPGESASETRVLRIARPDELDQVNTTIGFPIEAERNPVLSQRMLIVMTERLRDRAPRLASGALRGEAGELGTEQGRLRARVGEQIFTRSTGAMQAAGMHLGFEDASGEMHYEGDGHQHGAAPRAGAGSRSTEEVVAAAERATGTGTAEELGHRHDEDPILDVNRTLVTVYNAMWAAERALNQAGLEEALRHQHIALTHLQQVREGERVFARGRVRVEAVDVAAARGGGEVDEAAPAPRSPARAAPSDVPGQLAETERLAAAVRARPAELAPSIGALAARLLADPRVDARAGALVARAAEDAARGRGEPAAARLAEARRLLDPRGASGSAPPLPQATDPRAAEYFRRLGGRGR